jgi:hypothetical protein
MTEHPLTNTICEELSCFPFEDCDEEGIMTDMRAAADWQLEKVIDWLKTNIEDYVLEDYYSTYFLPEAFFNDFKKAMRPQEEIK